MHLRDLVKKLWANAGLYAKKDAKLQTFLHQLDDRPLDCWRDLIPEFRAGYMDLFDDVVRPLIETKDPLLQLALVKVADVRSEKEVALLQEWVESADPVEKAAHLDAIERLGHSGLRAHVRKRREACGMPPRREKPGRPAEPTPAERPERQEAPAPTVGTERQEASAVSKREPPSEDVSPIGATDEPSTGVAEPEPGAPAKAKKTASKRTRKPKSK